MPQPQPSAVIATTINEAAAGLEARADADIIVYAGHITRSGSQEIERLCRAKQHKANDPQARPGAGQPAALDGRRRREEVVNHLDDAGWPVRDAAASGEDD